MAARELGEHCLPEIATDFVGDIEHWVKSEIAFARAVISDRLQEAMLAAGLLASAAVLAILGLALVLVGIATFLALWIALWAAFLIVAAITVAASVLLARAGIGRLKVTAASRESALE